MNSSSKSPDIEISLVRIESLRPHERTIPERARQVLEQIRENKLVDYPILVDRDYMVILDGHHRYRALCDLSIPFAPVARVRYDNDRLVKLEARPNCPKSNLTKKDVLRIGLSADVFPPKSTRHTLREPLEPVNIPLDDLRDGALEED